MTPPKHYKASLLSLSPFLFFLLIFIGTAIASKDFYAMPVLVAFVLTACFSFALFHKRGLEVNIKSFCKEAGHYNVILMVLIFLLAGSFGSLANHIGAVQSIVNICLTFVPPYFLLGGLFLVCCLISLSMGSSMATVITLSPIALGITKDSNLTEALVLATVVGGAMFGDNLSIISDTTIAAVRTQGCEQIDKLKHNFLIVLPAALIAILIYCCFFHVDINQTQSYDKHFEIIKILPYAFIIVGALLRFNVLLLLVSANFLCIFIDFTSNTSSFLELLLTMHNGMKSMEDLALLSIIAAGITGLIKDSGGLNELLNILSKKIKGTKSAELCIALTASIADVFTANNTIAILISGSISKEIAKLFKISAKRSASLLDIFSSAWQGILPYGAQVLAAVSFANLSPLALLPYSYYPYLTLVCGLLSIRIGLFRKYF